MAGTFFAFSSLAILLRSRDSRNLPLRATGFWLSKVNISVLGTVAWSDFLVSLGLTDGSTDGEASRSVVRTDLEGSGLLHWESVGDTLTPESQESLRRSSELLFGPQESFLVRPLGPPVVVVVAVVVSGDGRSGLAGESKETSHCKKFKFYMTPRLVFPNNFEQLCLSESFDM